MVEEYQIETVQSFMREAISESFELMAFIEVEEFELLDELPDLPADTIWTEIEIHSPVAVSIKLLAQSDLARALCSATLGEEVSESEDPRVIDLLCEFLNTLTGSFLRKIASDSPEIDMNVPEYGLLGDDAQQSDADNTQIFGCELDEGKVFVSYSTHQQVAN